MWINPLGINNRMIHYENCAVLYRQECMIMACTYLNSRLLEHLAIMSFMASIQA